ncbi:hypothetical protein Nepgr_012377 [Nepenthes gracilis]|uniref:Uncharacterized protein n=1 Tax=Nepenthes gracilis TaxID=150966 RepID=A0AAD3SGV2_NEPGR|nr:hypothetical protein Nepgr_012377 [Nepenthes gracilis]
MAIGMLEAVIETDQTRLAAGFIEAVETIDTSCAGSLEFEVARTIVATGPTEELDLGPLMLEVREGEEVADIAALKPPFVPELKIFQDTSRLGRCCKFEVLEVAYSLDEESTSGLPVSVTVEGPHKDWLEVALAEVVVEGNEVEGAKEVVEMAIGMLEVVIETDKARPAAGFTEAVETIDTSCAGPLEFEVTGTVAVTGPTEELDLGPLMLEVYQGEGVGDIASPKPLFVPELKIFQDTSRLGRCCKSSAEVNVAKLTRDAPSPVGKLGLPMQRGDFLSRSKSGRLKCARGDGGPTECGPSRGSG